MKITPIIGLLVASLIFPACQGIVTSDGHEGVPSDLEANLIVPEHGIHYLELVTTEPQVLRDFYSKAYGWEFSEATPELGGAYFAFMSNGSLWAIRGPMRESEAPVIRTYLRVHDIESAMKDAEELGALIALGPMEIPGRGIIAIYILGGIEQGLWQIP